MEQGGPCSASPSAPSEGFTTLDASPAGSDVSEDDAAGARRNRYRNHYSYGAKLDILRQWKLYDNPDDPGIHEVRVDGAVLAAIYPKVLGPGMLTRWNRQCKRHQWHLWNLCDLQR